MLGAALVQILHLGHFYPARALIDSGSEGTLISERLFRLLKLSARATSAQISGLNNGISAYSTKFCPLILSSNLNPNLRIQANASFIPKVTGMLPSCQIDLPHIKTLG